MRKRKATFRKGIKLADLKEGDIIYIRKMLGEYSIFLECEFMGIERGLIIGKIINTEPEEYYRDFNKGYIVKTFAKNTYLWGRDNKMERNYCHWYNKETKTFK